LSNHFHYITVELADLENIGNNTNDMFPSLSNIWVKFKGLMGWVMGLRLRGQWVKVKGLRGWLKG